MAKRLEHIRECDGEDCELPDQEILEGINIYYKEGMTASEEDREEYHNEDNARQAIEEDPLSIEVRTDWYTPGEGNNKPSEDKPLKLWVYFGILNESLQGAIRVH